MLNVTHYRKNENQNHNEVSSHASQDDHHQKVYNQLSAGEGVENPLTQLMGMQTSVATMENSVEIP